MSVSLYRKYRPQTFSDVYGQKGAIDIITNSILKNRVGHAYLFSGSRGCGKTSVARIFAKALNCLNRNGFEPCGACNNCTSITAGENLDVIEIDGASNNGVDNIRELKENVTLAPFTSKYKIYIVDEVHMLSQGAFNALLKTLEEPPEHVIFILATTEPHKVPVTIRSRCQHIPFHSITPQDIYKRLEEVCKAENFNFEPGALWEISRQADGALRDALSLLEQVTAAGDITLANVEASFGTGSRSAFERWMTNLRTSPENAYEILKSMFEAGASGVRVFEEIFALVRDLWLVSKWQKILDTLALSDPEKKFLREESLKWKTDRLHYILNIVNKILSQARLGLRNDILLGMFFMLLEKTENENIPSQIPVQTSVVTPPPFYSAPPVPAMPAAPTAAPVISRPVVTTVNDTPNVIDVNEEFKEKILTAVHESAKENEKNFPVFCGILDSRPYEQNGNLILDFETPYPYEFFKNDRNNAKLSEIFSGYKSVILVFGSNQIICKTFSAAPAEKQEIKVKTQEPVLNNNAPVETETRDATENKTKSEKNLTFNKIKNELDRLGINSEIISVIHHEAEENEENSEELENNSELGIRNSELEDED